MRAGEAGDHGPDASERELAPEVILPDEPAAGTAGGRPTPAPRPSRATALIAGLVAVAAAMLLGMYLVTRPGGEAPPLDVAWAEFAASLRGQPGLAIAYALDWLGGHYMAIWVIPIGGAVALLAARRPWGALFFLMAEALSAGAVQLLKQLFARARPQDMIVTSDFGSFPSGHVANAATIAVALALLFPLVWVRWVGGAYVALMAFSRTYLGAHWLTDTIGGALIGAGVVLLLWALLAQRLERERTRLRPPRALPVE